MKKNFEQKDDDDLNIVSKNIKYNEEVNKYIKKNIEDKEYGKMIEENPQELLSSMDALKLAQIQIDLFIGASPSG